MEWVRTAIVMLLLGRAIYTDVRRGVIENKCMMVGLMSGLICAYIRNGIGGTYESIKMAGIVLAILFLLFLIKGLGAGDIKLLCVLATFYPKDIFWIVVLSFIVAAGIAIGMMLYRLIRKEWVNIRGQTLNFSIPIGCGTLFVVLQQWMKIG